VELTDRLHVLLKAWRRVFMTPNGRLSVANIQIAWGLCLLAAYLLDAPRRARIDEPSEVLFISGLVILLAGGVAFLLETRIEQFPDLASWPAPMPKRDEGASDQPYWLDIAVLQLAFGAVVIPLLSIDQPVLAAVGWRLVAITVASEAIYLAFLATQLVQKDELSEIFREIGEAKKRIAAAPADGAGRTDESRTPEQLEEEKSRRRAEEDKLKLLQDRAAVLMRQIGRAFPVVAQPN
jgi:ribosomal protein L12E/L44/L45/RPP1/RPP2